MAKVGKWAFIVGIVIAAVGGAGFEQPWFPWALALLGIVVGLLNVTATETQAFLVAGIGLIVSFRALGALPYVGDEATAVLSNISAFVSAALVVVALKGLLETARD